MKKLSLFIVILSSIVLGQPEFDVLKRFESKMDWVGPYKIVSLAQIGGETIFQVKFNGEMQTVYLPGEIRTIGVDNLSIIERMFKILLSAKEKNTGVWLMVGPKAEQNRTINICLGVKLE